MTVGRVATIPFSLLVLVSLSGCVEDKAAQCSSEPGTVHSIVIRDDQTPRNDVVRLDVLVTGIGPPDVRFAVVPWSGETVFHFPYRLAPIIATQDGGTVTVTARNAGFDPVSTGTITLGSGVPAGCMIDVNFAQIELN